MGDKWKRGQIIWQVVRTGDGHQWIEVLVGKSRRVLGMGWGNGNRWHGMADGENLADVALKPTKIGEGD